MTLEGASYRKRRWCNSPRFKEGGRKALARHRSRRWKLPKCGARRKSDGKPCQNLPLENGRCRLHGGLTPRGDQWGVVQYPSSPEKLARKIADLQRREKKRAARIAAMTPEERARYERWCEAHRPGPKKRRAALKVERENDRAVRKIFARVIKRPAEPQDAIKTNTGREPVPHDEKRASGQLWPTMKGI
jgi:hypothetical protein